MHKRLSAAVLSALFLLCSCNSQEAVDAEIKIPILGEQSAEEYSTAVVSVGDLVVKENVAGNIGYYYEDELYTDFESNLLEYCVERGQRLNEGDPIAVFDSSEVDYDYNAQKILTDNAYASYAASGSEAARLEYEIQAKQLEYLAYQKDLFTIRAPYDCFVTSTVQGMEKGTVIAEGTLVCTVAKENEVYLYAKDHTDYFRTGMPVGVKFGSSDEYSCNVVMTPETGKGQVVISFADGELERVMAEIDNVLTAGWATLIVPTVEKYNVMLLPEAAVKTFSGSSYCMLVDNGRRVRVPVELDGVYNGTAVILSGVSEGDVIAY